MLNVSDVSYSANIHSQYSNSATLHVSWVALLPLCAVSSLSGLKSREVVNSVFDESLNKIPHGVKSDDSGGQRNSGLYSFPYQRNQRSNNVTLKTYSSTGLHDYYLLTNYLYELRNEPI